MSNIKDYEDILMRMEDISDRAGDGDSSAYFKQLRRSLESKPAQAIEELVSNTFWGGAGSFFDQEIIVKKRDIDTKTISVEFKRLLLELLRLLRANGHAHPWFDSREELLSESIGRLTR